MIRDLAYRDLLEEFIPITQFRQSLAEFAERSRGKGKKALRIEVLTDHGKPVATVIPYSAYVELRELFHILRAKADMEAGRLVKFKAGTSPEEVFEHFRQGTPKTKGAPCLPV